MSDQENIQKNIYEQRLNHQLEIQSRQIDSILSQHEIPAQVAGGRVQSRSIRFDFYSHLESGLERLRGITQDLLLALGVPDGKLVNENGNWQLFVTRPEDPPVSLLDLLPILPELPAMSVPLGVDEDGRPVIFNFLQDGLTHCLIAGNNEAGKTSLLRAIGLSLALAYKQSQLQIVILDVSQKSKHTDHPHLDPLTFLPHMLGPVAHGVEELAEYLKFLVAETKYRQEERLQTPRIVVLIDEVMNLLANGDEAVRADLAQVIQRGGEAGIYILMSTERPESSHLSSLMRANLPARLVGRVNDASQAVAAVGKNDSQAKYLLGKGDFLAYINGETTHFQAAYIGDYDLHLALQTLHRQRSRPLLAHPISLPQNGNTAVQDNQFRVNGDGVEID
ncbi:MAG: hypothetical protein GY796_28505 [Chloroflexi bacterium]|nr:hypothetical protein [Chloroflexota bacterium]